MKTQFIIQHIIFLSFAISPISIYGQTIHLEIDGAIKINDDTINSEAGMIRWNTIVEDFEGYNGTDWVSLTNKFNNIGAKVFGTQKTCENYKLLPVEESMNYRFGASVDVYDDLAIVGIPGDNQNGEGSGSATIFTKQENGWSELVNLTPGDGASFDWFGSAVAINTEFAIVGAYGKADHGPNTGALYIFKRNGNTWIQEPKVLPTDADSSHLFGYSVALFGHNIVVGAPGHSDVGATYIFQYEGNTWSQDTILQPTNLMFGDEFGKSVSLFESEIIIGNEVSAPGPSSAYNYRKINNVWKSFPSINLPDTSPYTTFASKVSQWGNWAVISAPMDTMYSLAGAAFVYEKINEEWVLHTKLIPSDGTTLDFFGSAVDIYNECIIISAWSHNVYGNNSGAAYVFQKVGNIWAQQVKLVPALGGIDYFFGSSVSIWEDQIFIGSNGDDDQANQGGSVYIF